MSQQDHHLVLAFPEFAVASAYKANGRQLRTLGPLGRINLFVGANNAGKSRLLRAICRSFKYQTLDDDNAQSLVRSMDAIDKAEKELAETIGESTIELRWDASKIVQHHRAQFTSQLGVSGTQGEFALAASGKRSLSSRVTQAWSKAQSEAPDELTGLRWLVGLSLNNGNPPTGTEAALTYKRQRSPKDIKVIEAGLNAYNVMVGMRAKAISETPNARYYLPILRSTTQLDHLESSVQSEGLLVQPKDHEDRAAREIRASYDLQTTEDPSKNAQIKTGQRLFHDVLRARNSTRQSREKFDEFLGFVQQHFFPDSKIDLVAAIAGDHPGRLVFKLGDATERPLHDLGDGIQALLLLLYPIFMAERGSWIFIEEPETNLHPGFQRLFLKTILNNSFVASLKLRFFISTHSNHLVDHAVESSSDVAMFHFSKSRTVQQGTSDESFIVRNVLAPDHEILRDLGVRNGSVLLANCAIWVEGPTDRMYINAFIRAYQSHLDAVKAPDGRPPLLEDLHYGFFEYGGSLLSGYDFTSVASADRSSKVRAQFIANHVALIADRDDGKEAKHAFFKSIETDRKDFRYVVTEGREIENLLSSHELKDGLVAALKVAPEEVASIETSAYVNEKLGAYLSKLLAKPKIAAPSGTLSATLKARLAAEVASEGATAILWSTMSSGAKALATDLYEFIQMHNDG